MAARSTGAAQAGGGVTDAAPPGPDATAGSAAAAGDTAMTIGTDPGAGPAPTRTGNNV